MRDLSCIGLNESVWTHRSHPRGEGEAGFTLIELLVVITIIVVLLALLTPALDGAIYQAQLTLCATQLDAMTGGLNSYAFDHNRSYPHRAAFDAGQYKRPNLMRYGPLANDLTTIEPYIPWRLLLDPLNGGLEVEDLDERADPETAVYINYPMWFNWKYDSGGSGPSRLGQGFRYGGERLNTIVGDWDLVAVGALNHASHFDREDSQSLTVFKNTTLYTSAEKETLSRWGRGWNPHRAGIDVNHAGTDGSVVRFNNVSVDDDRLVKVPYQSNYGMNFREVFYAQIAR